MSLATAELPIDPAELRDFALACQGELKAAQTAVQLKALEIEKLKFQIAKLRRVEPPSGSTFGRSSERINRQIEQLEFRLEELETGAAEDTARAEAADRAKPKRNPLPDHLSRQDVVHQPADDGACTCPDCGRGMARLGEDVTEVLDYVPGHFQVIRHVRPKYACTACDAITQAPAPAMPTPRGRATPGTLAHLLVAKYCDHLPLYRQSEIYAREGLELDRSTLCDWVGQAAWLLDPVVAAVRQHVFAAEKIHGDDTTVPVLAPGLGRTKHACEGGGPVGCGSMCATIGRSLVRHPQPPPTSTARTVAANIRPITWPGSGFLQADGYAGFEALYDIGRTNSGAPATAAITEVACWAHCRRKFFDVWQATKSPVAKEALDRIAAIYVIAAKAQFAPAAERVEHRKETAPLLDAFFTSADATVVKLSAKSALAEAFRYTIKRRKALSRFVTDGRLEADNNIAENAMRAIAVGRKNYLFCGSDTGGDRAASIYTLVQTAKLNGVNPETYLKGILTKIADGHPINRINELMPWRMLPAATAQPQ